MYKKTPNLGEEQRMHIIREVQRVPVAERGYEIAMIMRTRAPQETKLRYKQSGGRAAMKRQNPYTWESMNQGYGP